MNTRALASISFMAMCATGMGGQGTVEVEHPVMRFTRGADGFPTRVAEIERADDERLRRLYLDEIASGAVVARRHERRVYAAVGLWKATGDARYRTASVRACHAMLGDLLSATDERLQGAMDADKGFTARSRSARDAAYHLALLYDLTGEQAHAHRAAVLLARFAEVMPNWPIQSPHYGPMAERKLLPRDWPDYHTTDLVNGIWGGWIYGSIGNGAALACAYDLIHRSGELQRLGVLEAVERELNWGIDFQLGYGREMGNMDATTMRGLIDVAQVLGRPEVVHHCIDWVRDMLRTMFFADGWWHEGSVSYHQQIHNSLQIVIRDYLQGYSDPPGYRSPDGTRYDALDLLAELKRPIARAAAVLHDIHQPNGNFQCIHDTSYPQVNWEKRAITKAESLLWGCVGHAILGGGENENMVQATLHFSGIHGHAHYDTLNFMLFAKGKELVSETRYRSLEGSTSTREWHTMTAGHATVVLDEKNQTVTSKRQRQPADAIAHSRDGKYRWAGHGNHMVEGKLRIHNTDFSSVQVVEADGSRAYGETNTGGIYRRTIALVRIGETDSYVVDIFRVRGGSVHDYMLHGCLDDPHTVEVSVPLDRAMPGTVHTYIGNLRAGSTDASWTATFVLEDGAAKLRTFFLPQAGTQVICGDAPAMRRIGTAPFLCVRQSDGESIYVAVHHPYTGEPVVQGLELLESRLDRVAFRVLLRERIDTVVSTAEGFSHTASGEWAYEIGGRQRHEGMVRGTRRIEAGDDIDAFVTDTALPADGTLDGATIMIDLGGLLVQSFTIDRIERVGDETIIHSRGEPGMTISPGLIKLEYFPCWGISGLARFCINGARVDGPGQ